jgi:cell division protein ZapA
MAEVSIQIGGRDYSVHCRDGGEDHLRRIAGLVDAKAQDAERAVGGVNETRQLLFAALLLADELNERKTAAPASVATPPPPPAPAAEPAKPAAYQPDFAPIIEKLAARLESLAERLEGGHANP